jgi:hypothetical protein
MILLLLLIPNDFDVEKNVRVSKYLLIYLLLRASEGGQWYPTVVLTPLTN